MISRVGECNSQNLPMKDERGPTNYVWKGDYFGATWPGIVELARQGRRDYLDVTRSGFLVWGGVSSQSVSAVNLIKAGGRRRSSREQVPLTVEPPHPSLSP